MNSIRKMPWSNSTNDLVHSLGGYPEDYKKKQKTHRATLVDLGHVCL